MLRRLTTALAATSALVLTAAAPAFADHNDPDYVIDEVGSGQAGISAEMTIDGQQVAFEYKREELCETLAELFSDQDGKFDLVLDKTFKYEKGSFPPHEWISATSNEDWTSLDIVIDEEKVPNDGEGLHVIVKAGTKANVYLGPDLTHLTAPDDKEISHYSICKVWVPEEEDDTPPPEDNGDDGDEDEEESEDKEESTPTPTPSTTTPAPVPTAVPAGTNSADGGSMAPVGLAAAALMMLAGGAALLRRRFAHQN